MADARLAEGVPSIPEFRCVKKTLFEDRERRLRHLARGHAMEPYLRFAAALARAQSAELYEFPDAPLPDASQLERCRQHGLPPLSIGDIPQAPWQGALLHLLEGLNREALPSRAAFVIEALRTDDAAALDRDAENLLAGDFAAVDPARLPFIGAALQAHWAKLALKLGDGARSPGVEFGRCPVCGSPPVAGLVRTGGAQQGLRYLVCSLCSSEWHLVRVKCSSCSSTAQISYLFVEDANDAVRAECCDDCKSYLKLMYLEKDHDIEPVADDLATLALDLLVDEQGYQRPGPNLLLAPGFDARPL